MFAAFAGLFFERGRGRPRSSRTHVRESVLGQIFFTHAGKYTVAKRARSELQLTGLMIGLLAIVMYSYIHITIPHLTIYTVKYIE